MCDDIVDKLNSSKKSFKFDMQKSILKMGYTLVLVSESVFVVCCVPLLYLQREKLIWKNLSSIPFQCSMLHKYDMEFKRRRWGKVRDELSRA